jgi:hypothetical protein
MTREEMAMAGMILPESRKSSQKEREEVETTASKAFDLLRTYPFSFVETPKIIGKIMPIEEFITCINFGKIIIHDGTLATVFVNGRATNINVINWGIGWDSSCHNMRLEELRRIDGKVEIEWCNK